jgi:hypothetical protein
MSKEGYALWDWAMALPFNALINALTALFKSNQRGKKGIQKRIATVDSFFILQLRRDKNMVT